MQRHPLLSVLLLSALGVGLPAPSFAQGTAAPAATSADERLRALYEREWAWRLEEEARLAEDPRERAAHLPRVDAASQERRLAYWSDVLEELDTIPAEQLSPEERINAAVFRTMIETDAQDVRNKLYEAPFNADTFFWTQIGPRPGQGFEDAEAYRRYLGRLRDVPRYFDEQIANMRSGLARGFSIPQITVVGRDETIVPYLAADTSNPLYTPFEHMPATIPADERMQLQSEAQEVIRDLAAPAYSELLEMIRGEYMQQARTTLGASELPDGRDYYQAQIDKFTNLEITPEEIHQLGLSEVARIRADMEEVIREAEFDGTFAEFLHFLRTDPQFYAKTPRELLSYSAYVSKKADAQIGETIGTLPRYRHGIQPVPPALAPIYTGGRGGLENCLMNTYNLPARPLYTLPALTLHECTPGHSFQAALALEGPDRPDFRKQASFTGYGEGWGLYTEWLGTVMGIYETPYEDFGRLSYEMWRAARLVIDTGLHSYGWTREQAQDYLKQNTALSEHEITTEIDRYIAWPGQAVAYKLGELLIRRKRAEAEATLGADFDQRWFHDVILSLGSVPLPVLEQEIDAWIAAGGPKPESSV